MVEWKIIFKAPRKICSRQHFEFFIQYLFSEKISLDTSYEASAGQTFHMKCQDLLYLKNKIKIHLLQMILLKCQDLFSLKKKNKYKLSSCFLGVFFCCSCDWRY